MSTPTVRPRGGILGRLDAQVLLAVALGAFVGHFWPATGVQLQPLGDVFIQLLRLLLVPVIFGTIVLGLARMERLRDSGRIGLKALVYFEVVSTFALIIGLVVANVFQPGAGMHLDARTLDKGAVEKYATGAGAYAGTAHALAHNPMLQTIVAALVAGILLSLFRAWARKLFNGLEAVLKWLFFAVSVVMRLAPIAAFGAVAYTVGQFGFGEFAALGKLLVALYGASLLFVFGVLGLIMRWCGFSLWKLLQYLDEEIAIVFATVSTEAVLPRLVGKLVNLGCARPVVGLVLPAGYTFNLDGGAIYLSLAALFIAQATDTPLTAGDQALVMAVLLLTSKGSGGVAGAGFVALAATLSSLDKIPVAGLVLLLGIDRFMNIARALTNLIGNAVATIAVAAWENALDRELAAEVLGQPAKAD